VDEVAVPRDDEVQGREQQFWRVYEASVGHVYGFLVRRCDRETAQDLTQEVFLYFARRVRDGDYVSGLGTAWLLSVARSRLVDHLRAEQRRNRKLRMAWSAGDDDARRGRAAPPVLAELEVSTERALQALSSTERFALVLHHLDGVPLAEVAASLDRSVRATESLLARARRKFRAAFDEDLS
jgi:RNA polymerase sigma-70 factor (ECF subfamily)